LSGHQDYSEENLEAPLISISFGNSAVFLIGGKSKDIKPKAICLKSGDILIMSGESRLSLAL
jgi:alkylated DNA repair protein alkB family protein 1